MLLSATVERVGLERERGCVYDKRQGRQKDFGMMIERIYNWITRDAWRILGVDGCMYTIWRHSKGVFGEKLDGYQAGQRA